MFVRWLQKQIAFNELGLVDKSALNGLVVIYMLAAAFVYLRFVRQMKAGRWAVPDDFGEAFYAPGKLFTAARWAIGGLMFLGGLVLFATCEADKNATLLRIIAILAMLSGGSFIYITGAANKELFNISTVCTLSVVPAVMYAVWLICCYKANSINPVLWAYSPEIITICVAMLAFFRCAGFAFSTPTWKKAIFWSMLGGCLCIMSVADERNFGQQLILIASALELTYYVWAMVRNLRQGEAPAVEVPDDGFERL